MKKNYLFFLLVLFLFDISFIVAEETSVPTSSAKAIEAMSNPDYIVTTGDVYSISFLVGHSPVNYTVTIDSTYKMRVANLAVLNVSNMSFLSLKKQVEEIVSKNYPMSGVQFNLINPGSFKVIVKGEVPNYTQEVSVWALSRLSSVVGSTKNAYASTRNVVVKSKNGKEKTYDLYKARRYGDYSEDPYVRPGDVITLSEIDKVVSINGAVKRPGTYELLKEEGLKELIEYYGDGLAPMADTSRISLFRTSNPEIKSGEKQMLNQENIDNNYELLTHDVLSIPTFNDLKPIMFLQGAVNRGGAGATGADYTAMIPTSFTIGETYKSLLLNIRNLFGPNADLSKAYILRGDDAISIDIYEILYNNAECDIEVEANDILTVPSKQLLVSVLGAVAVPGRYPYLPGKNWNYYINLAGGFINEENSFESIKIVNRDGVELTKDDEITPETVITAKSNDFLYYVNTYGPVISMVVGTITSVLALVTACINFSK